MPVPAHAQTAMRLPRRIAPAIQAAGDQPAAAQSGQITAGSVRIHAHGNIAAREAGWGHAAGRRSCGCHDEGGGSWPELAHMATQPRRKSGAKAEGGCLRIGQQQERAAALLEAAQSPDRIRTIRTGSDAGRVPVWCAISPPALSRRAMRRHCILCLTGSVCRNGRERVLIKLPRLSRDSSVFSQDRLGLCGAFGQQFAA